MKLKTFIIYGLFNALFSFSPMKQIKFYERWKDESKTTKTRRGILTIIYMIVSIVLYIIALDHYQGYNNWRWEF